MSPQPEVTSGSRASGSDPLWALGSDFVGHGKPMRKTTSHTNLERLGVSRSQTTKPSRCPNRARCATTHQQSYSARGRLRTAGTPPETYPGHQPTQPANDPDRSLHPPPLRRPVPTLRRRRTPPGYVPTAVIFESKVPASVAPCSPWPGHCPRRSPLTPETRGDQ